MKTSGRLHKRSRWIKRWRARHFELRGELLVFSTAPHCAPHGVIDLRECSAVRAKLHPSRQHCFEIETLRQVSFLLSADSAEEQQEWIQAIRHTVLRHGTRRVERLCSMLYGLVAREEAAAAGNL